MIRHCVMLRFRPDAPAEAVEALAAALRGLPAEIPEIKGYEVGPDLGWREGNAGLGIAAVFDDQDGWRTYADHPAHLAVIDQHVAPIVESRLAVQFEI